MLNATPHIVKHPEFGFYYFVQMTDAMDAFAMSKDDVLHITIATVTLPIPTGTPISFNHDATRANVVPLN